MVTIVVKLEVSNFIEWKKIIDANENMRKGLDISLKAVYISIKIPESIMVVVEAESQEKFQEYFCNDPEIKKIINEDKYMSEPNIEFFNRLF